MGIDSEASLTLMPFIPASKTVNERAHLRRYIHYVHGRHVTFDISVMLVCEKMPQYNINTNIQRCVAQLGRLLAPFVEHKKKAVEAKVNGITKFIFLSTQRCFRKCNRKSAITLLRYTDEFGELKSVSFPHFNRNLNFLIN